MNIQQYRKELKNQISLHQLDSVLASLKLNLNSSKENQFIKLSSNFTALQINKLELSYREYRIEANRIIKVLLAFIDALEAQDIFSEPDVIDNTRPPKIENPILLVGNEVNSTSDLLKHLEDLHFQQIIVYEEQKNVLLEKYDLVILDNRHLVSCLRPQQLNELTKNQQQDIQQRIRLMENFIKDGDSKFLVHLGNMLYWINNHREKVQAANSLFSLYTRTKEVLEFLKMLRGY